MTESEFHLGMEMLVDAFRPYKWRDPDSRDIYWRFLAHVEGDVWIEACKRIVITDEDMPSVAKMTQTLKRDEKKLASCPRCDRGRVHYTYWNEPRQVSYERYCACTCASGDIVADRIRWAIKHQALQNGKDAIIQDAAHYQWPSVKMRLGDALRDERYGEKKSWHDYEVPAGVSDKRRRYLENMRDTILRIGRAREQQGLEGVRTEPTADMAF